MNSLYSFSRYLVVIPVIFFLSTEAFAQDAYEEWRQQYLDEYQQFKDERDSLFTEMLNRHWEQFDAFQAGESYSEPKPETIPSAEPVDRPRVAPDFPEDRIPTVSITIPEYDLDDEQPIEMPPSPPPSPETPAAGFQAVFYNHDISVPVDDAIRDISFTVDIGKDEIAEFWESMSRADYEATLEYFEKQRDAFSLNDWGFAKMVYQSGMQLYNGNQSLANMFCWFFLSKAGFDNRVGYNDNGVFLMLPVRNTIFAASYFDIKDQRYYVVTFGDTAPQPGPLYSYDGTYPDADAIVSTEMITLPEFKRDIVTRELSFSYGGETYEISVDVNRNLIAFYEYYPQTEFEVYFNAPVATETARSLLNALKPVIEDKSETEAVNMLLRFVQTAFDYKVDPEHFGREKPMFPEETIYYDYSDWEDRAILFSFLVRNLTGLDVVGLHYPGHVATAVRFTVPVEGDRTEVNGETYIISDPTYINADIGMEMPEFKGLGFEIISVL